MDEFIDERAKLVRLLAESADPFTKIRLLKLADHYDSRLRPPAKVVRQLIGHPRTSIGSSNAKNLLRTPSGGG
jgi:hypothetical protein